MIILHVAPVEYSRITGLATAIPPLVKSQSELSGVEVGILLSIRQSSDIPQDSYKTFTLKDIGKNKKISNLEMPFSRPDIVIFHSTYIPIHWKLAKELTLRKIPYIIMPHGGMTYDSLRVNKFKYIKKTIVNYLYFNKFVKEANKIHYLNTGEAKRSSHWDKEHFILGNGIKIVSNDRKKVKKIDSEFRLTFIGRMDVKIKGLDLLLMGIYEVKNEMIDRNVKLYLYGPAKKSESDILKSMISKFNLSDIVILNGPVLGAEKRNVLEKTDVFVLTSRTEGHPMSVIEALSYGVPCLVTRGTNFDEEINKYDCGWAAENTKDSIKEQLIKIINEDEYSIAHKGEAGKNLINEGYAIEKVAAKAILEYQMCLES